jgi:hypothetical protein
METMDQEDSMDLMDRSHAPIPVHSVHNGRFVLLWLDFSD